MNNKELIGRISSQLRGMYKVLLNDKEVTATLPGKYHYNLTSDMEYPVVGDYVVLQAIDSENYLIDSVCPRKTYLKRNAAGLEQKIQGIVANVETIFICTSVNNDFNLRKIERYLTIVWDSGSRPVIVLTKADLQLDIAQQLEAVQAIAFDVPIIVTSHADSESYHQLQEYMGANKTIAFIGSSGVGKSTIINHFLSDDQKQETKALRNDDAGRHTTTTRELFILEDGTAIIDTPGMREISTFTTSLQQSFTDIETLAITCKFTNCQHDTEPGCAIKLALEDGSLDQERYKNYQKLLKEVAYTEGKSIELFQQKIKKQFGSQKNMRTALKEKRRQKGIR